MKEEFLFFFAKRYHTQTKIKRTKQNVYYRVERISVVSSDGKKGNSDYPDGFLILLVYLEETYIRRVYTTGKKVMSHS